MCTPFLDTEVQVHTLSAILAVPILSLMPTLTVGDWILLEENAIRQPEINR